MQHFLRKCSIGVVVGLVGCAAEPSEGRGDAGRDGGGFVVVPDGGAQPQCRGNRDGVIDRGELVFVPGVEVRYRVNPAGTLARMDTRGAAGANGARVWDFSDTAGELITVRLESTEGQWYAGTFAGAQYASRLDPRAALLGVYRATDTAVELMGVAGPTAGSMMLIPYTQALQVLRFPLRLGLTWVSESTTRNATVEGTPAASRDRYEITVDQRGEVRLEALTFPDTLRVRVELTQTFPAGPGTRRIQYLWVTECYGEVARAVSPEGQVDPEFGMASEFRRLGF